MSEPPPQPQPQPQPHFLHSKVWNACAGAAVALPKLGSRVYYFPLGHAENAGISPSLFDNRGISDYFPCIVSDIKFLADTKTEEIFLKLLLTPLTGDEENDAKVEEAINHVQEDAGDDIVSVVKVLTQSHLNTSTFVPISCARSILPSLDHEDFHMLNITDLCGKEWSIKHTRSANRHVFTSGWGSFVNGKKLVTGDTVIFIKDSNQNIIFGIRRKRNLFRSVTESDITGAVQLAGEQTSFEVAWYPSKLTNFVVDCKRVDDAVGIGWQDGTRVRRILESDKSEGTITAVSDHLKWRMLEVNWDEPDHNPNCNPWEVERMLDSVGMQGAMMQGAKELGSSSKSFKLFGNVITVHNKN